MCVYKETHLKSDSFSQNALVPKQVRVYKINITRNGISRCVFASEEYESLRVSLRGRRQIVCAFVCVCVSVEKLFAL